MLEMLVSSRIRRALLERILTAPQESFYLRGLARELAVSVTPLRREIKRLERSGLLIARPEANAIFYQVNTASPTFHQLKSASAGPAQELAGAPMVPVPLPATPAPERRSAPGLPSALRWVTAGVAAAGLALGIVMLRAERAQQPVPALRVEPSSKEQPAPSSASAIMRGSRWQLAPIVDAGGVH